MTFVPHGRLRRRYRATVAAAVLVLSSLAGAAAATGAGAAALPSSFRWSSSGPLISPKTDARHPIVSVKDPTVVRFNNQWLVYMTTANTSGSWSLAYTSFGDWSQAAAAPLTYLDQNPNIGTGYRAAPQLFFFAPKNQWYLVYQTGPPSFSTASNPTQPQTWTAPRTFIAGEPAIVTQNKGPGGWIDFWVICDTANCYLFFSDDNGHLYRAQTTVANFPNGFGNTQIVLQDSRFSLFEASNVYKIKGSNSYLLVVEAIGSDGRRYFRSWTSSSLAGQWSPLANTEANPFARAGNVTFPAGAWTRDISHGEMVRSGVDQTLEIDPCHLQYLYQGMNPSASGDYSQLPWRLGLLTQTNSTC
jgi:endo-1,4-beta-xylanase